MKCPVCNSEMYVKGKISITDGGLPVNLTSVEGIPFYECNKCRENEPHRFAYQRTLVKGKWYYFDKARWNYLKEVEFNPSRRES